MSTFKKRLIIISSVLMMTFSILIGGKVYYDKNINGYPDTANFSQKVNELQYTGSDKKTVLIFHKPGCADCLAARDTIKSEIKSQRSTMTPIVINVHQNGAEDAIAKYGVTNYPTVIYLEGAKVVDSTTSTQPSELKRVLRGN